MENKIFEMLVKMDKRFDAMEEKIDAGFAEVNDRLTRIEKKLDGAGYQFESVTGDRIEETAFLIDKLQKLELEVFRIKRN